MLPLSKLRPLCLGLLLVAGIASAHDPFESTTTVRLWPAFVRVGQPAVSILVASAGIFWLLQRTVLS